MDGLLYVFDFIVIMLVIGMIMLVIGMIMLVIGMGVAIFKADKPRRKRLQGQDMLDRTPVPPEPRERRTEPVVVKDVDD